MAKVHFNPFLEQIRGHVGELVFKRYGDKVIISRKADLEDVTPSEAQAAHRERFQQAVQYGKAAMADPVGKGLYLAAGKARGIPPFSCAVADYFHAPSVGDLDLSNYAGSAFCSMVCNVPP
jgi:hypothetical protein